MTTALLALGGNQGNVLHTFQSALAKLDGCEAISVVLVSQFYDTTPVGIAAGERYLNAAVKIEFEFSAVELLYELQDIEIQLGRVRTLHWGPRTLDLDIIGIEHHIIETQHLSVPHVACWYRRFVLDPLVEIAPNWVHPVFGQSVRQLRDRLLERPLPVHLGLNKTVKNIDLIQLQEQLALYPIMLSSTENGVINFVLGTPQTLRSIQLFPENEPVQTLQQVLTAVFDEPHAISSPG